MVQSLHGAGDVLHNVPGVLQRSTEQRSFQALHVVYSGAVQVQVLAAPHVLSWFCLLLEKQDETFNQVLNFSSVPLTVYHLHQGSS